MKKLIVILLLTVNLIQAQNASLFIYINQYRVANGKSQIEWSTKLNKISETQTDKMNEYDSVFHSKQNVYECVLKGITLTPTPEDKEEFTKFLSKYFHISYDDPAVTKNSDIAEKYLPYYTIYMWDKDPAHKDIMLTDNVKEGSCNMIVKSLTYKSNKVLIGTVLLEYKKIISHYDAIWFVTLNLK